jgi:hypothetical protein
MIRQKIIECGYPVIDKEYRIISLAGTNDYLVKMTKVQTVVVCLCLVISVFSLIVSFSTLREEKAEKEKAKNLNESTIEPENKSSKEKPIKEGNKTEAAEVKEEIKPKRKRKKKEETDGQENKSN